MPELYRHTPFSQVLDVRKHGDFQKVGSVYALEDEFPVLFPEMDFLGIGGNSVVVSYPDRPDKAISYYLDDMYRIPRLSDGLLAKYHMHRVLSILYPHHFPRLYASAIGEHGGTVRERVHTEPIVTKQWYETSRAFEIRKRVVFDEMYEMFDHLGDDIKLRLAFDRNKYNYARNSNKHPVYMDFISNNIGSFHLDVGAAVDFIRNRHKKRRVNPKKATPIADGIVNEVHAFLSSMRRLREYAIMRNHIYTGTEPLFEEVRNMLLDIGGCIDFETDEQQDQYYKTSYQRILVTLEKKRALQVQSGEV